MKARDVAQSLFPEILGEKAIGYMLSSVFRGSNADLMRAVAPLYLTGSVMDCTYGEGGWWLRFTPEQFTAHDLRTDGVDFTALPEPDNTYDAVCFDPPYIPQGGTKHDVGGGPYRERFGLISRTEAGLWGLIASGLAECARVTRHYLLVKCTDYANGKTLTFGHIRMMDLAATHGLYCHDLIVHHTGPGPGGHNIFVPKRARRAHSYLIVLAKP